MMKSITLLGLALLVAVCLLSSPVMAPGNFTRPTANTTITPISTQAYNDILTSMGGNTSPVNETDAKINWTQFLLATLEPYTIQYGYIAYIIIFALPFIMMWLMHVDVTPAAVAGIILGAFMLAFLPSEYSMLAGVFIALAVVAVVYSLLKERM